MFGDESQTEEELDALIFKIGDPSTNPHYGNQTVESNIESNSTYIINQIVNKREQILDTLLECASKLPEKMSIYTTLLGIINYKNSKFIEEV